MSDSESDGDTWIADGCVHPFQCPNPLGQQVFASLLGEEKANKMRYGFQQLFCYWVWLKKGYYWKVGDTAGKEAARSAIQKMSVQLVQLWPRECGQG